ncbi:MAG: thioredoxin family protein [Alistipes sp.]
MKKTFFLLVFSIFVFTTAAHAQIARMTATDFLLDVIPKINDDDAKCVFLMYSNDCQYSLRVYHSLNELSYEFPNIPFYAICVDEEMWVFDRFDMKGVPTYGFVNFSDSQMYSGVYTKSELRRKLQQIFH